MNDRFRWPQLVEFLSVLLFGAAFCAATLYLSFSIREQSGFTSFVLRVVFSVALSALSSCVPSILRVKSVALSAGSAILVFCVSFLINPPGLIEASSVSGIEARVQEGRTLISRGKYNEANNIFVALSEDQPSYVEGQFYLGVIDKINARYKQAENHFRRSNDVLGFGGAVTHIDKSDVLYEIAMMQDGQLLTLSALHQFESAKTYAPLDAYLEGDIEFEIARLELLYWIKNRSAGNYSYLRSAAEKFEADERHDTPNRISKLWTWYHLACVYSEMSDFFETDVEVSRHFQELAVTNAQKFMSKANLLEKNDYFNLALSIFMAYNRSGEYVPGAPLACRTPIAIDRYFN